MLCKHCGAQLPDGTVKCKFCGTVLSEGAEEKETSNNLEETKRIDLEGADLPDEAEETPAAENDAIYDENERKRQSQIDKMISEKERQLSEIQKRREEKKAKQQRNKILLIALAAVLVLAVIGGGAYYVRMGINEKEQLAMATPTPAAEQAIGGTEPTAAPEITPLPTETAAAVTDAPANGGASSGSGGSAASNHSWSSTGNTGSGSSGGRSASSGGGSSGASSASSGSSSSGGSSSGASGSSSSGASGGSSAGGSSSGTPVNSGISSANISARLAKGGEVITNSETGRLLMTFTAGNTVYYANVAPGSTTEQIKNMDYTITAFPTGEVYNGNTIYEITSITGYSASDYVLPHSGTRPLTNDDIKSLSKSQLAYARNEIYARHGRAFQMKEFSDYFAKKSWYHINPNYNYNDDDANLNEIEQKNVKFLLDAENSK